MNIAGINEIATQVNGRIVSVMLGNDVCTLPRTMSLKCFNNPFNSSQKRKQSEQFAVLRSRLMKLKKQFDAMLGHGYGRLRSEPSRDKIYRDRSGQEFWQEMTGDPDFYIKLIRLMENEIINKHRQTYHTAWEKAVNRYLREFTIEFCQSDGAIDWEKLVAFNSGFSA